MLFLAGKHHASPAVCDMTCTCSATLLRPKLVWNEDNSSLAIGMPFCWMLEGITMITRESQVDTYSLVRNTMCFISF